MRLIRKGFTEAPFWHFSSVKAAIHNNTSGEAYDSTMFYYLLYLALKNQTVFGFILLKGGTKHW